MDKLLDLKGEIFAFCRDKFTIFESETRLEEISGSFSNFKPDDWKKFVDIANATGTKLLYYYEDSNSETHQNDIGLIQIGFNLNGITHIYSKSADWYIKIESEEEEEDQEYFSEGSSIVDKDEIIKIIQTPSEEILEGILNFLKETGKSLPRYDYELESLLDDYFSYRYDFRYRYVKDNIALFKSSGLGLNKMREFRDKTDEVLRLLEKRGSELHKKELEEELKKDDEILKTLVPECVDWAVTNSLPKLNKSNVYDFCRLKDTKLSNIGMDRLYILANKELKRKSSK